ncbi:MAG: triose-phosphate isomerase [Pseudomonadota bacterium]
MRKSIVAGNWKMNGDLESTKHLVSEILEGLKKTPNTEVIIFPPYVYLDSVGQQIRNEKKPSSNKLLCGVQDICENENGAFTGEISTEMLKDFYCTHIIIGHSERRHIYQENNELCAKKFLIAANEGYTPILCLGETLEERNNNQTHEIIAAQLETVIGISGIKAFQNAIIAYEPVWAIGTGQTATPEQAQNVHEYIRAVMTKHSQDCAKDIRILYGGSVNAENAKSIFLMPDIDGGLIGGASLNSKDFLAICESI